MKQYNIAVVGATGMVGRKVIEVIEERNLPAKSFFLFAAAEDKGKKMTVMGKEYIVDELTAQSFDGKEIDIAIFSAGATVSRIFAPIAASNGVVVIDNSSQWRMDPNIPLVVPEVNPEDILKNKGIIANPNCSTIQAIVALKPLYDKFGIERINYSTYQAASGAGMNGYWDLERNLKGEPPQTFQYTLSSNVIPHIDVFMDNGYTKEEMKMINETHKMMHDDDLKITATTVRVPVFNCHSEAINVQLKQPFELEEVFEAFGNAQGVIVYDNPAENIYPMPIVADGKDEVFVGRIRRDFSVDNGINFFCVADNVRKGAATNAVQIAQKLISYWEDEN